MVETHTVPERNGGPGSNVSDRVCQFMEAVVVANPGQPEFHQAVREVVESVMPMVEATPAYQEAKILQRLVEPERVIMFRVPWTDDQGEVLQRSKGATPREAGPEGSPTTSRR